MIVVNLESRINILTVVLTPTRSQCLKRSYEPDGDFDNVDAMLSLPASKRSKSGLAFTTVTNHTAPTRATSAKNPASRSPVKAKRGRFSRQTPQVVSNGNSQGALLPISLDAVLELIVSSDSPDVGVEAVHVLDDATPITSKFNIHEDSHDQEMTNLLTHSACTMDISSDDESSIAAKEALGKENISPTDGLYASVPTNTETPASRKDLMTDQPRTPLGDLDPAGFDAEGCDENSYLIIPADDDLLEDANYATISKYCAAISKYYAAIEKDLGEMETSLLGWTAPTKSFSNEASSFDIWESESANGEEGAHCDSESGMLAIASNAE